MNGIPGENVRALMGGGASEADAIRSAYAPGAGRGFVGGRGPQMPMAAAPVPPPPPVPVMAPAAAPPVAAGPTLEGELMKRQA